MDRYTQRDPRWSGLRLGSSPYFMGDSGCYVTACAQILRLAGYPVTPGEMCLSLDSDNGFTHDGLAEWAGIVTAYPQFKYESDGQYLIVQMRHYNGNTNQYEYHYYAKDTDGTAYDPWTGSEDHPSGYADTGVSTRIKVDHSPDVLTVIPVSVVNVPSPAQDFWVEFDAMLHVRSHPTTSAPIMATYPAGSVVECKGVVPGEAIDGETRWYVSKLHGYYFTARYSHDIPSTSVN